MRDVTVERDRVTDREGENVALANGQREAAPQNLQHLPRSRRVRLAGVGLARAESPIPELENIRRLRARHQHPSATRVAGPQRGALPAAGHVERLILGEGATSDGKPTPRASLRRRRVPTLALATPCSTLTSILRLTPATPANWSRVHRRSSRSRRTRTPIAAARVRPTIHSHAA